MKLFQGEGRAAFPTPPYTYSLKEIRPPPWQLDSVTIVRPRLNDYHRLGFTQEEADFAIPFLDEDIPFSVDPFLLWKSPSQQDQSLHVALLSTFNHVGHSGVRGSVNEAIEVVTQLSECEEVGLGHSPTRAGRRLGKGTARDIISLFATIPQVQERGLGHLEEIQLLVEGISRDRIGDFTCNILKSFLIDYTISECRTWKIPTQPCKLTLYDLRKRSFVQEEVSVPINPDSGKAILLVPKRWLRRFPWISTDDFIRWTGGDTEAPLKDRPEILNFNRHNYDRVLAYVKARERCSEDCHNDPLFSPIPILSAKRKLAEIKKLPTGNENRADKLYEERVCQLLASLLYPHLDFAQEQSRTDSGVTIRDLIFYNNRSLDFLSDIWQIYDCRQLVFELKNVRAIERDHINQLNRYLTDQFGRIGVLVTRNRLPAAMLKNTIDLWSGQRKCILALTDEDLETMVEVFESKQRLPIEVLKRTYIRFTRLCPS